MKNARRAFLDAVRKSMREILTVIGATTIDPNLLTAAEHLHYEGYLRREETDVAIPALSKSGTPIKQIVRSQTGYSRKLIRHGRRYNAATRDGARPGDQSTSKKRVEILKSEQVQVSKIHCEHARLLQIIVNVDRIAFLFYSIFQYLA